MKSVTTTTPAASTARSHEFDALCRWGTRAAWHVSLLWGVMVALLSWTAGAKVETATLRGLVTVLTFGLLGWGVNAVVVQGRPQEHVDRAAEADGTLASEGQAAPETAGAHAAMSGAPGADEGASEALLRARDGGAPATKRDDWQESDYLAEAAS